MRQLEKNDLIAGVDLGSSYTKIVLGDFSKKIKKFILYPSSFEVEKIIKKLKNVKYISATGHLKNLVETNFLYSEAKALGAAFNSLNQKNGTLIDVGGQDLKILIFKDGKIISSKINRRCASGTGSFLDFISFKLNLKKEELNKLAKSTKEYYPINSYCTVFASYEIIELLSKKIKKESVARGIFYSMALRILEMGPFEEPVYLVGGVLQHYPVFSEILSEVLKTKIKKIKNPQFFLSKGAYLLLLNDLISSKYSKTSILSR